jgi:hypothetical protein
MFEEGYAMMDRRRQAILKKMAKVGPFMMATPVNLKVKCGNPDCKCAKKKEDRHEKLHLSWGDADGQGTAYVPVDLRKEVLEWVENYWTLKDHIKHMTALSRKMIKIYAKTLGAHKRRMARKAEV